MARVATKLTPTAQGGFSGRKRIPADVQDEYQKLYGKRHEERFNSGAVPVALATKKHREWLSEIEARIENIRAERKGTGRTLTPMQARALSGAWYRWFTTRRPVKPEDLTYWKEFRSHLIDRASDGAWSVGNPGDPEFNAAVVWEESSSAREQARAFAADYAETSQFLHTQRLVLDPDARELFLDYVVRDLFGALDLLIRRAKGDYSEDTLPKEFPRFERASDPSLTPWALFERWITEVKPAASTVDRWRGVFLKLKEDFPTNAAAALTPEEVREWLHGLINEDRTARTVRDVWKVASRRVFGWAVERGLITRNPFDGVKITVPRKHSTRDTKAFTDGEVKTILTAASAISNPRTKGEALRRWAPWLCAYTGARAGEIAQLRGSDVIGQEGVSAIKITPDAGTVKTRKPRTVPLHEHLIKQGFLEFAKEGGRGPLFYKELKGSHVESDPTNPKKPRSVKAREHLAAWVRELGVTDPEVKPNHAWRETFKQIGHRHDISERLLDAIAGHAPISVGRGYGLPTLDDMAAAMKKFPRYDLS
jgi:integrase